MANDRCPTCGASYALVGRVHRCRVANTVDVANSMANMIAAGEVALTDAPVGPVPAGTTRARTGTRQVPTYRYRDPEKRRAYMRQLMRRKRAATHH